MATIEVGIAWSESPVTPVSGFESSAVMLDVETAGMECTVGGEAAFEGQDKVLLRFGGQEMSLLVDHSRETNQSVKMVSFHPLTILHYPSPICLFSHSAYHSVLNHFALQPLHHFRLDCFHTRRKKCVLICFAIFCHVFAEVQTSWIGMCVCDVPATSP